MLKSFANLLHSKLSAQPAWLIHAYLLSVSLASRALLPTSLQHRVHNSLFGYGYRWPQLQFAPRQVRLGKDTDVLLTPHVGEFDEQALFFRSLPYEQALFTWLEPRVGDYGTIIEIGANVGVYSVFFDRIARHLPPNRQPSIVVFEPSGEAYSRLLANLRANDARHVATFQAAVGERSGLQTFYEPRGHLTNGSFTRSFAEHFSDDIQETAVLTIGANELGRWFESGRRTLVKIDVEGFEPQLLSALSPLLEAHRPDLLIEVLPESVDALSALPILKRYDRFLITRQGERREEAFYFSQEYFDWFLTWNGSSPAEDAEVASARTT